VALPLRDPIPQGRSQEVKISADAALATLTGKEIHFAKIGSRRFIRLK
jgi:hypothetical protein